MLKPYWERSIYLLFLDFALKWSLILVMKRDLIMNVARSFLRLLLNMMKIIQRSSDNGWRKNRIKLCIFNQIVPLQPYFHNEFIRWRTLSSILDTKFFLNTWELLKILYVIPVGMKNKEKYFSLKSWIHNWLRNNISTDLRRISL